MENKTKIIIGVMIALVVGIGAYLVYAYGFNNNGSNTQNNTVVNNTTNIVNTANNTVNNVVENTVKENTATENVVEVPENKEPENNTNSEVSSASDEEKAMAIAKEAWGDTDGVYFNMEGFNQNGDYRITVSENAKVLAWYYVNVSAGTYTVEFN